MSELPAISVYLDGERLATVNTDGFDVISVHVHGTKTDAEFATLEMSGGCYPEIGESTHLIWIDSQTLIHGQLVEIRFEDEGETNPPGKTIDQLFPDEDKEAEPEPSDFNPPAAMFADLRAKPQIRHGFAFQLSSSSGANFVGSTANSDHGFGFSVIWNSQRPSRAGYSLHAYTLDELESRSAMRDYLREYIQYPSSVTLRVED
ncbi:MAG: hypothetical protein C4K60_06315 [Ideonella sp. MAG2]|nr:MAG: hypothetical protein C4K60_06315 [Ideonella sp. MAG2]